VTAEAVTPFEGLRPRWLLPLGVGGAYLGLAQGLGLLSEWVTGEVFQGPVFWPAAGLALGVMLVTPRSRWPGILAAVFVAEALSNAIYGISVPAGLGWALANTAHPLVAAGLIRRLHPGFDLGTPAQLAAFVAFAGVVGPASSALVGTAVSVAWWNGSWSAFWSWWIGDGLGALVVAPLFVAFRRRKVPRSRVEVLVGSGLLTAVTLLVFRNWGGAVDTVLPYLVLPPLVWAAFRTGLRGGAFGVAVVGMIGGWSTALGYGPFAAAPAAAATGLFQLYLVVVSVTALLIAVLVGGLTEREAIQREAERRQRQQAALAQLGNRALTAERREEVMADLGMALRAIAEAAPGESPAPPESPEPPSPLWPPEEGPREMRAGSAVWEPLAAHRDLLDTHGFVERYPIEPGAVSLMTSASTIAANALDRLAQEERLRERAEELEGSNGQLARALTFREQLVSTVGHELRSPLTPILGFADVLRRSVPGDGSDPEFALDAIERNARRILTLIDELLLSARASEGDLLARPAPTDVASTLRRALEHGFDHVEVSLEAEAPLIALVDPVHVSQCVLNLVTNAIKYGEPPIVVRVRDDGPDRVVVEVTDRGPGVPPAMVPVLFDRFTQADEPSADTSRGVGLGLAIVQSFVDANDGSVVYHPPEGDAPSTFELTFPRA
jgi:signal transduction histidine kinase/integral membrane sensor domain MASE1